MFFNVFSNNALRSPRYLTCLATVLLTGVASAQDTPVKPQVSPPVPPNTALDDGAIVKDGAINKQGIVEKNVAENANATHPFAMVDQLVLDNLSQVNQQQLAMSEFAVAKVTRPDVKLFAEQMVTEHQQLKAKLQQASINNLPAKLAGVVEGQEESALAALAEERRLIRESLVKEGATPREARQIARDATREQAREGLKEAVNVGANLLANVQSKTGAADGEQVERPEQVIAAINQKSMELSAHMIMHDLDGLSEEIFDQTYLGLQLVSHNQMIGELQAAEQHVSPELRNVLSEATQMLKEHKQHALKLLNHRSVAKDVSSN